MKTSILLLLTMVLLRTYSAAQTTFLYVDVSGKIDRELLKIELEEKYTTKNNLVFFLSNDNMPIVEKQSISIQQKLEEFSTIKSSTPISYKEVDTILTILDTVQLPINLAFFLEYNYAKSVGLQNLVERLLLCSGWMDKESLKSGIIVTLYFQKNENLSEKQIKELSKNGKYEVFIY